MLRRIFTALAALSLVLLMATLVFWFRNSWCDEGLILYSNGKVYAAGVDDGCVGLLLGIPDPASQPDGFEWRVFPREPKTFFPLAGFKHIGDKVYLCPLWFLTLLFAFPPAVWFYYWRRSRKPNPGHCHKCGYDLRASPGACPECGAERPAPIIRP